MAMSRVMTTTSVVVSVMVLSVNVAWASAEGGADPFGWSTDLALWTLIIFLGTMAILWKYAFGPIVVALDAREKSVADQIASAERANSDAKELLTQYQRKLSDAQAEAKSLIVLARGDAQRQAEEILQQARAAAEQQQERARQEIEAATTQAIQSIAATSATLATELAGKMIKREIKAETHRDLIAAALQGFSKT